MWSATGSRLDNSDISLFWNTLDELCSIVKQLRSVTGMVKMTQSGGLGSSIDYWSFGWRCFYRSTTTSQLHLSNAISTRLSESHQYQVCVEDVSVRGFCSVSFAQVNHKRSAFVVLKITPWPVSWTAICNNTSVSRRSWNEYLTKNSSDRWVLASSVWCLLRSFFLAMLSSPRTLILLSIAQIYEAL